jgi:hypothetical protein
MIHQHLTSWTRRLCGVSLAALVSAGACVGFAADASADVVLTRDGQWWPKSIRDDMAGASAPSDTVLQNSGKNNVDLQYDKVKIGNVSLEASSVVGVWSTTAFLDPHYNNGDLQGQSGYWAEAAASFAEAAEELKDSAKQIAMWQRVQCLRNSGDAAKTFDAAQELLDAFPKAYYFAPVQDLRARVLYIRGDKKAAAEALDLVAGAPGMNARDYFEAKLAKVYLFEFKVAGKDKAQYAKARQSYDRILKEIGARGNADDAAVMQRLQAEVGIGKCYVYEQDYSKASTYFEKVIADKASLASRHLLAQAYTGLGDVKYATIKAQLATKPAESDLPAIQERLTDAALDYLRVAKFYVADAGDELFPATVGVARVWATQFHLGGDKDCPLALRATKFFYAADGLLGRGEPRRILRTEIKQFLQKRDDAGCKPGN